MLNNIVQIVFYVILKQNEKKTILMFFFNS